jgi:hypothetical protein
MKIERRDLIPLPKNEEEALKILQFRKKRMLQALYHTHALVTDACRIASVTRYEHNEWLRDDPEYKRDVEFIQEGVTDMVESKMYERINGIFATNDTDDDVMNIPELSNWPENLDPESEEGKKFLEEIRVKNGIGTLKIYRKAPSENLIAFYLRTKGRSRGYAERTEITGAEGQGLFAGKTDTELVEMITSLTKKLA